MPVQRAAVIVDIVDSRSISDRAAVQSELEAAFASAAEHIGSGEPLAATVGDEFQGVYPTVGIALEATLAARLALPEGVDCRFGIGWGELRQVGQGVRGVIQDGPAWWRARAAIDQAHEREDTRTPSLRSWFAGDDDDDALTATVNAYLLTRDHLVGAMSPRARRLAFGTLRGLIQAELAEQEGISQGAVSQSLRRSGAMNLLAATALVRAAL